MRTIKITQFEARLIDAALATYIETLEDEPELSMVYSDLKNLLLERAYPKYR